MGLWLEVHTGRSVPEALGREALALAARNMEGISTVDRRRREADLMHPQTKLLLLRRAVDPTAHGQAQASDPPCRRSRSRHSDSGCGSSSRGPAATGERADVDRRAGDNCRSVVGYASFRHVTQETLRVVYLYELHLEPSLRRRGLGSNLLDAVGHYGRNAQRQGLLLTVHLTNLPARSLYAARGLVVSPTSPSACAPPHLAADYDLMQCLWCEAALRVMEDRGAAAYKALHGVAKEPPLSAH